MLLLSITGCNSQNKPSKMLKEHQFTNDLIKETSPYLLQHAHNPVQWHAWNAQTLELARKENKPLLISIGYAACHWCHVMEHESFENEAVAEIMNAHFICVKVDREERPDIDQIYMDAVQLLTGRGGWPLNCIALPDGSPFWGGTYFPKDKWVNVLTEIGTIWNDNPEKIEEYAAQLTKGVQSKDMQNLSSDRKDFSNADLTKIISKWEQYFDYDMGGLNRAPKFPMPNNYHFLLRYAVQEDNSELLTYVNTTLTKMAYGGIYDQIGGGFARYATDTNWHIPHFEKMLYDNAQLVSLYADAYLVTKNPLYKDVVYETLDFVTRELTDASGAFYSSLDADSDTKEGLLEEGAFYVWTKKELQDLLGDDFPLFQHYYNINDYGHWENDRYVLTRDKTTVELALANKIDIDVLESKVTHWKEVLLADRDQRPRPRLDNKVLTSWNALMSKAFLDAYRVFGEKRFLDRATKNSNFYLSTLLRQDGGLYRNYKEGTTSINAYLEDYATLIDALIALYEVSLKETYLSQAKQLIDYTLDHFFDSHTKLFYFTSDEDPALISRKIDVVDNVVPSANSMMGINLYKLGQYYENAYYSKLSHQMLLKVFNQIHTYPSSYSNWLQLVLNNTAPFYEIAITGPDTFTKLDELNTYYIPNKLIAGSTKESSMPLLQQRYVPDKTLIYVCVNKACKLPVTDVLEAVKQLE